MLLAEIDSWSELTPYLCCLVGLLLPLLTLILTRSGVHCKYRYSGWRNFGWRNSCRRSFIKMTDKLNRSTTSGREEQRAAKREMAMYPITVVLWLLNSWLWFCCSILKQYCLQSWNYREVVEVSGLAFAWCAVSQPAPCRCVSLRKEGRTTSICRSEGAFRHLAGFPFNQFCHAAAAAKSLQSRPTLCDPIGGITPTWTSPLACFVNRS